MKYKFFIFIILGIINAIVIGIIVKQQGIDNTTSVIKGIFNSKISENTNENGVNIDREKDFSSTETIINEIPIDNEGKLTNNHPLNENTVRSKISKEEIIENSKQINNQKELKKKLSIMADLEVSHVNVGPLDVNCYIIGDPKSKKALVIDPGGNSELILEVLKEKISN